MAVSVSAYGKADNEVQSGSTDKDRSIREAQQAVVGLLGRLSELMTSISEDMRDRYEHALALREFAQTMYLAFGQDLSSDVGDIQYDRMEEFGPYIKSNLLGDNRLREAVAFLGEDNEAVTALLEKLETQPGSFSISDGLELMNQLLGVEMTPDYYRNAAGNGFRIAFDQMNGIMTERKNAMDAALREAQQPIQILQEMLDGQESTLG